MLRLTLAPGVIALLAMPATAQDPRPARPDAPVPRTAKPVGCQPTAGIVTYRGDAARPRTLADMPPAAQIYTVYNVVDGCPTPVVVRDGIGGNPSQQQPVLRVPPRATNAR